VVRGLRQAAHLGVPQGSVVRIDNGLFLIYYLLENGSCQYSRTAGRARGYAEKEEKMKRVLLVAIFVLALSAMVSGGAAAQEDQTSYAFGEVVQVTNDSITVTEMYYDEDTEEEVVEQVQYSVSPDAELENIGKVSELKEGQEIDIEYLEAGGKKEATYIYVYTEEE